MLEWNRFTAIDRMNRKYLEQTVALAPKRPCRVGKGQNAVYVSWIPTYNFRNRRYDPNVELQGGHKM